MISKDKFWRIELKKLSNDPEALELKQEIFDFGIKSIADLEVIRIFFIKGLKDRSAVEEVSRLLLVDNVTEISTIGKFPNNGYESVEILLNPGVMDPQEENIVKALSDIGYPNCSVKTGRRYLFKSQAPKSDILKLAPLLYNPLIQHIAQTNEKVFIKPPYYRFRLKYLPILNKTREELSELSERLQLALNQEEMLRIKNYYQTLGRNPTDIELETFAQTWSEHCKHKTLKGIINFKSELRTPKSKIIDNLLKSTIFRVTKELKKKFCLSVFKDNSGVIEFDENYAITFKVETHNHPSALEPYGGAATGVGGVIRDCLGTGLGAKPILNTDVFCFAPPDFNQELPQGVLQPRRVIKGVVRGVRDYGNRMGIPTAQGAVYFMKDFVANPLVFCGTVGIIPKNKIRKRIKPGDLIVLIGGKTGRDGIHGVTFASQKLTKETGRVAAQVVQIGNPIEEKKITDVIIKARDLGLINAITDCGGGGLSSAIGELAEPCGALVELDKVPLKYTGLSYTEIWISESQERMILFITPHKLNSFVKLCAENDVMATAIGKLTNDKRLRLYYKGSEVGNIDLGFLHKGWRGIEKQAVYKKPTFPEPDFEPKKDLSKTLLKLLASPNIASKEWIIRQYDFEVQGRTVLKPFARNDGPSDACVIKPLDDSKKGLVIASGMNPRYGLIDPYWMAASSIDEALRNLTAVGGDIGYAVLLDNFCWGNPDRPEELGKLVRACYSCYDIARLYQTPFISGKDSLYNEFIKEDGTPLQIPPTLLISSLGVIDDFKKTVTIDFKKEDSIIYLLGLTYNELGGSEYFDICGHLGNRVPKVNPVLGRRIMKRLHRAIKLNLVNSVHDLSEGGLGVSLAEMAFSGDIGVEVAIKDVLLGEKITRNDFILFAESNSRFLCEVDDQNKKEFEELFNGLPIAPIGRTRDSKRLEIYGLNSAKIVDLPLAVMRRVWRAGLSSKL